MLLGYFWRVFAILSKRRFFHPLNRNDDLKESGVGVGVIGILGVGVGVIGILGVGVGILGKLGVGVGPYTIRLRNPDFYSVISCLNHPLALPLLHWSVTQCHRGK